MKLSETHLSYLKMYHSNTSGLEIPYSIAKMMEIKGLVESVPSVPPTRLWMITKKGRAALTSALRGEK